jgi:4-hydroxy-tetrahydrodipicolinate synthase
VTEFKGSIVAIVTPFRDGRVDLGAFRELVSWHSASGTAGIVVAGTTGEAPTLEPDERDQLYRAALSVADGRCLVIAGTGTNDTRTTVRLTRAAVSLKVDGVLVVTPYYNKPTQEGLFLHFRAAAESALGRPVILYDVPSRTGVTIAEETLKRLAAIKNVKALKDATRDVERAGRVVRETPLTVLAGDDALTLPLMRQGAKGVVSVAANVVPQKMADLCAREDAAIEEELQPLFRALFVETNPIPVKFALARMGRITNELRLPLTPLATRHEPEVVDALKAAGALP